MTSQHLFLIIDLLCIFFPLLASFHSKAPFYKRWKSVGIAIVIPAIIFVIWDEIFTRFGIWGFNPKYISGVYFGSLPIEEVIFFVCIPYASLFSYFVVKHFIQNKYFFSNHELLSFAIIIALLIAGIFYIDKAYTAITFLSLSFYLAFLTLKMRAKYLGHFYAAFGLILVPFFVVNGILTGSFIEEEVVWYNNEANIQLRLATIPIEDIFYAMLLLLMNTSAYEWLEGRLK